MSASHNQVPLYSFNGGHTETVVKHPNLRTSTEAKQKNMDFHPYVADIVSG